MTFGVISYRWVAAGLVGAAGVLLAVPALTVVVPLTVFSDRLWLVLVGLVAWAAATGVQDSTVKAYVAGLVPTGRRATAYGVFAAVQGVGALTGGTLAGALVERHVGVLALGIAALQVAAAALLAVTLSAGSAAR